MEKVNRVRTKLRFGGVLTRSVNGLQLDIVRFLDSNRYYSNRYYQIYGELLTV